ncbi:FAD-dependent pyridine nucleotide-disulfide oxidoreductase [Thermoanaerobacterium thermosaccharolyticum]|uniref:Uncharacterized protein n=2 Tax=Thermoanaerobacterium thermosaccharolyticum TaxID=1517 RepID=D9TR85_THETC|nr:hypothetical protein [Thermoanaerobacterium thermosaccharolyticum]ADL69583.1 hypothetical protein Tthe_2104 [Thermoanaerobacterium thermosaccharolyticum DSM 571]AST56741.1 FAD-dependent pyridine nucleotide-disulfide oxidoreductase [Thermoanaerobacterium thermosaccharolyticum]OXT08827.1 hypothetical protein CE561_04400 [Thermoanaerobacterium thermosaccharolyticum]TCW42129.1 hypothetical protein EDC21_10254 [Thermohydrogenium kirishiense]
MLLIITLMVLILIIVPAVMEKDNTEYSEFMRNEFGYKDFDDMIIKNEDFSELAYSYKLR